MRRRIFLGLLGVAATTWPLAVFGQQNKNIRISALDLENVDAESFKTKLRKGPPFDGLLFVATMR